MISNEEKDIEVQVKFSDLIMTVDGMQFALYLDAHNRNQRCKQ